MKAFPFPGLNLALATPFKDDGAIDYKKLEVNIERYLEAGIESFVISSGTGMHVYLSQDESQELVKRGAKIINGRAKVIAQTSALMLDEVITRSKHAADCGASGIMVLPPFFEGPTSDDEIVDFYASVATAGMPIIGYNVPQVVGVAITPELLGKLCSIPEFCTVKDSSGDFTAQATLIRTGHPVMNGADPLALYALYAGCSGLIWGGASFAPRTCLAMVKASNENRWEDARAQWAKLEPAMAYIWEGDYVKKVYAAAEIKGYSAGVPRKPLSAFDAEYHSALKEVLRGIE